MTRRILRLLFASGLLLVVAVLWKIAPTAAGPFEDARDVYDRGDFATARQMFEPLAQQGDRKAQTMMGHFHAGGRGFPQNIDEADKWYRLAAAQAEPIAQYNVFGIELQQAARTRRQIKPSQQAVEWLRQSAEQDFPAAQFLLSMSLHNGQLLPKNEAESFRWLRRAADFEIYLIHFILANRYLRGEGVEKNVPEAYFWASVGKRVFEPHKNKPGAKIFGMMFEGELSLEKLGAQLTPEQRADLDRRAAAWLPKPLPNFGTLIQTPAELEETGGSQLSGG
jgi:hypothetical protein